MESDPSRFYQYLYQKLAPSHETAMRKTAFVEAVADVCQRTGARTAIEFGCGRGLDAAALLALIPIRILATDNVNGMLQAVPQHVERRYLDVRATSLQAPGYFDVSYCANLVHLLSTDEKSTFYQNAWSLTKPAGAFLCLTASLEQLRNRFLSAYFPSAYDIDAQRYLSIERNIAMMKVAGFTRFERRVLALGVRDVGDDVSYLCGRTCSIVHLLQTDEVELGLAQMAIDTKKLSKSKRTREWKRTLVVAWR